MSGWDAPSTWRLRCPWCDWHIWVGNRGSHGHDQGAGYEAAMIMRHHVEDDHGRPWTDFLQARAAA